MHFKSNSHCQPQKFQSTGVLSISWIVVISFILLGGTETARAGGGSAYLANKRISAVPSSLTYCSHHGCQKRTRISLKGAVWNRIRNTVRRGHGSPASERRQIAAAMKYLELAGGKASGTLNDKPRTQFDSRGQLDCVDEATNMTSLMVMLKRAKLLRHHTVETPSMRSITDGRRWLHYAGTVREKRSGKKYVIDSWFRPNGQSAVVVPVDKWKTGWSPARR